MFGPKKSDDYQPLTWIRHYPVYLTTLLVAVHVTTMIGGALAQSLGYVPFLRQLAFSTGAILHDWSVWQFVTYPFLHVPDIWFVVEMFLLYSFGREVEKFIGRSAFLGLYLVLILLPPCLLTAVGTWIDATLSGSGMLHFGVFVGFAALYPNVEFFFGRVLVKWIVWVLLAIYSLQHIAQHNWVAFTVLWVSTVAAYLYLAYARGLQGFPMGSFLKKLVVKEKPVTLRRSRPRYQDRPLEDVHALIDPLLEKISKHGLGSLTAREREKLEKARTALLKKKPVEP